MDWGKAKSVLIVSFLLLNILLGFQLWRDVQDRNESSAAFAGLTDEIRAVMQEKQIRLDTKIPAETPVLRTTISFNKSTVTDNKPLLPTMDTKMIFNRKQFTQQLKNQIVYVDQYELDPIMSSAGVFVLHQKYEDYPMFEMKLDLLYKNQMIDAYRQSYVNVFEGIGEQAEQVLSAYKAIGSLIEKYLHNGSVIQDIRLGYHGQSFNSQTQVFAPYWRITIEGGAVYYMHAISGAVEDPLQKEKQGWE